MNTNKCSLLDAATLPMLVWIYALRFYEPDDIVDECVMSFDPMILLRVLNDPDPDVPKHCMSRPIPPHLGRQRSYNMFTVKLSPVDVGVPAHGGRVLTHFSLSSIVKTMVPRDQQRGVFKALFHAQCELDSSIYMRDFDDLLSAFREHWQRQRRRCLCALGSLQISSSRFRCGSSYFESN